MSEIDLIDHNPGGRLLDGAVVASSRRRVSFAMAPPSNGRGVP